MTAKTYPLERAPRGTGTHGFDYSQLYKLFNGQSEAVAEDANFLT